MEHELSTLKNYTLRPTQATLVTEIADRIKTNDDVAFIASTGCGKTIMSSFLVAYYAQVFNPSVDATLKHNAWSTSMGNIFLTGKPFNQIIFIVHMDNLVEQTYEKFKGVFQSRVVHLKKTRETNMHLGITFIKSGKEFDPTKPIIIASLQTLSKRFDSYVKSGLLNPAMLIFDECHTTSFCESGRKLIEECNYRKRIGLTATPFRLEKDVNFSDLWSNAVVSPSFGEMVRRGELTPITYKQFYSAEETKEIKRTAKGEFSEKDAALKFNTPQRIKYAVTKWEEQQKLLATKFKTIVFTIDVAHGENVKTEFLARGYSAEIISYKTEQKQREPIYKRFASGDIQILISVRALAVGFDEPSCDCGIDLQPTTSISNHWQKIGRVARLYPGKLRSYWLDFTGNIERLLYFGCPDNVEMSETDVLDTKSYTKRVGQAPVRVCDECNTINHASAKHCKECNYEFPKKAVIDFTPEGDLITVVTKAMVNDNETARMFYRTLRHKRYIRRQHPNAAYHEYINTQPVGTTYPIPHPRERDDHKEFSLGACTGKPDCFDIGMKFLDLIIAVTRKQNKDKALERALIDSAIWLEFNDDIYDKLVDEIDTYDTRNPF